MTILFAHCKHEDKRMWISISILLDQYHKREGTTKSKALPINAEVCFVPFNPVMTVNRMLYREGKYSLLKDWVRHIRVRSSQ